MYFVRTFLFEFLYIIYNIYAKKITKLIKFYTYTISIDIYFIFLKILTKDYIFQIIYTQSKYVKLKVFLLRY